MFNKRVIAAAIGKWMCAGTLVFAPVAHAQSGPGHDVSVNETKLALKLVPAGGSDEPVVTELLNEEMSTLGKTPHTLEEVDHWSTELTAALRRGGFPIGQAMMTAEDWAAMQTGGKARFTVFPGRISKITVRNTSKVRDSKLERLITHALCGKETLKGVCMLRTSRLERTTQLLQDLPGVALDGAPQFSPGNGVGEVEVVFNIAQLGKRVSGDLILDNSGSDATGKLRTGVTGSANNLLGVGDAYSFSIARTNKNMWTGSLVGSAPIFDDGLRMTAGVTRQQYNINSAAGAALQGIGTTEQLGVLYPFQRGLDRNVWGGVSLLHSNNGTTYKDYDYAQHSKLDSVQLSLQADNGDRARQLRTNQWNGQLAITLGHQRNDLGAFDAESANVAGNYAKLTGGGAGTYNLNASGSLFVAARMSAQLSSKNLDASEKLGIGGPSAVRAYRADEGSLDEGAVASLGIYQRVPVVAGHQLQFGLFSDFAYGRVNHSPWADWEKSYPDVPGVKNNRLLAGYGVSVDWLTPWGATASVAVSKAYGFSPTSWVDPGKKPTQVWLSMTWNH